MLEKKKGKLAKAMIDEIWPIENTLIQMRALVKFTGRENTVRAVNNAKFKEKHRKAISELRTDIAWFRNTLASSLLGPSQSIHNLLREHKELQLAFEKFSTQDLSEVLWEWSCTKKKILDQLIYRRRNKTKVLTDYELEKLEHIENLEHGSGKLVSYRERALTNKIHQMRARKDAATLINKMYISARDVLKRDTVFFDNVLSALEKHAEKQMRFIIKTTEMGQNATEQHATIEDEFRIMEKVVRADMADRGRQVRALAREVQILEESYMGLVRTEREGAWIRRNVKTPSEIRLNTDLSALKEIMVMLQNTTHVSACEDIFIRMKAQVPQKAHLSDTVGRMEYLREMLVSKKSHAQVMAATLENKLLDSTAEYKQTKAFVLEDIAQQEEELRRNTLDLEETGNLMVTLRTSLQTLFDLMQCVKPEKEREVKTKTQPITQDAHVIMKLAKFKLRDLIELVPTEDEPTKETVATAKAVFQRKMSDKIAKEAFAGDEEAEFSLDIQELDDPDVMTRAGIKLRSKKIVEEESAPVYG